MSNVRTRFAPSPTGFLHVGNVRSALYPWLIAQHENGKFILRIEDTDQAREVEGAVAVIHDTLAWLGIQWDEGPDIGGPFGPYIQTERKQSYTNWAQILVDKGLAYADTRTPDQLQAIREDAKSKHKPFLARDYRPTNIPQWKQGMPLRFKCTPKIYKWHDAIMGDLSAGEEAIDDFIIMKSDGLPTYNFAHIIDDFEMKVTHVIRGVEYISSVPKYLSLYDALEFPVPILAHAPHIMSPDGNKKLSKRDGAKSILDYRKDGFLPEAVLNFLASLGWNDGTEQEIFTKQELIDKFSLDRVQKSGARFDEKRLLWMNGAWIRSISLDDLYQRSQNYWPKSADSYNKDYKLKVLGLIQERLKYLGEIPALTEFFFIEPAPNIELITNNKQLKKLNTKEIKQLLSASIESLSNSDFSTDDISSRLNKLLIETGQKPGVLFSLIRIASTWAPSSPGLADSLAVLGKEKSLSRLKAASSSISI